MIEAAAFTSADLGNVITAASVLVAAFALAYTWRNDQGLRRREAANQIRAAAAGTLAGLDLWIDLALSLDDNLQEVFVKVSQALEATQDVLQTRDLLWSETNRVHSAILSAQYQERLENTYKDLYGYGRDSYALFDKTMSALKKKEKELFGQFLETAQNQVLAYENNLAGYQPAELGNSFREASSESATAMDAALNEELRPFRLFLESLVTAPDEDLIHDRRGRRRGRAPRE